MSISPMTAAPYVKLAEKSLEMPFSKVKALKYLGKINPEYKESLKNEVKQLETLQAFITKNFNEEEIDKILSIMEKPEFALLSQLMKNYLKQEKALQEAIRPAVEKVIVPICNDVAYEKTKPIDMIVLNQNMHVMDDCYHVLKPKIENLLSEFNDQEIRSMTYLLMEHNGYFPKFLKGVLNIRNGAQFHIESKLSKIINNSI